MLSKFTAEETNNEPNVDPCTLKAYEINVSEEKDISSGDKIKILDPDKVTLESEIMRIRQSTKNRVDEEEKDEVLQKAVGKKPTNSAMIITNQPPLSLKRTSPTIPPDQSVLMDDQIQIPNTFRYPRSKPVGDTTDRQTIVPRPPITPNQQPISASNANGFLFNMSKKKDECVIPIKQVALFISNVMGEDFGYITKKMAKNMVAMIPKEAAILAIQTSKEDAKKFLDSDDDEIRREAIKKFFDIDDDDIDKFQIILSTPGFEVNPWS